nr:hypothetical protein GCM10010200_024790 [Actinomadura rugatobispora]
MKGMTDLLRRIGRDLRDRRHVEAYVVAFTALVIAAVSPLTDLIGDDLRWTVSITGIGLLVYRITIPDDRAAVPGQPFDDRTAFEQDSLEALLRRTKELWLFAPSGAHVLTAARCDTLRRHVLGRADGIVRVVVLDPEHTEAIALATCQLTDSVDFPGQRFPRSLAASLERLRTMGRWSCPGRFAYRLLPYNPGFSLIALDPSSPDGKVIVEFHGARNESSHGRMHITLGPRDGGRWYGYWLGQFEHIWRTSRDP